MVFALGSVWACFFNVVNFQWQRDGYLTVPNNATMTVGYEAGGFPSFSIYTPVSGDYYEPDTLEGSYNNATIFSYSY